MFVVFRVKKILSFQKSAKKVKKIDEKSQLIKDIKTINIY
jgi:hypothetical protein